MFPIETERLELRYFRESDIVAFSNYRKNPEVAKYQSWSNFTLEDGQAFYERQRDVVFGTLGTWCQIGISEKGKKTLIGDLAFHFFETSQVEIGFTLGQNAQKKGYAKEALTTMLDVLFNADGLNTHRVVATIDTRNGGAKNLLESLKFRQEGHYVENTFFKGEWSDEYGYALLQKETIL